MGQYPFVVIVLRDAPSKTSQKDFQTLGAAREYAMTQSRQRFVNRVELYCRLATYREGLETA